MAPAMEPRIAQAVKWIAVCVRETAGMASAKQARGASTVRKIAVLAGLAAVTKSAAGSFVMNAWMLAPATAHRVVWTISVTLQIAAQPNSLPRTVYARIQEDVRMTVTAELGNAVC